ncbi:dynein light chain 4, axonemal-like isoform X2 [Monomorium pharaonis]|uniref:dynein light chain 4, axonemal-like isoform X2 n=1 Tax=Monomorium pharaonis TaxID=307658 RepID=UPI0017477424|nr:dynein light chain 4, axonemal-like isoform X2 [Monomorium pharaonis]XP_036138963.1 dynein light chain 4, axonemal-like isoform X2 [Monomorium pharaonis]XP_036138964.1 dynein light chain 4, axonemal-like isoform X2 [Monomorium pharaonis]
MWAGEVKKEVATLVIHTYPLCKHSDMPEDIKQEAIEICVTAVEKYPENYEHAARMIKDNLDKKFGPPFQVVVGEAYACAITYQEKSLLYMFIGGNIAVLVWKTITDF